MLCKDPKCICHPRKPKPFQRLQLTLRGLNPDQVCRLDQPGAQLDIIFDLIGNNIHLREAIGDPEYRDTSYSINFFIESKMMQFENLKGLPNNDLLLSFRMRSSFCCAWGKNKMRYREKYKGFSPNKAESKLYNEFYQCDWPEQHLELLMPADRIMGWKTVALILKTFKRISPENWCRMVKLGKTKKFPRVAGLDWMAIEADVMPKKEVLPPTPAMTPEEEKKMYFFAQQKKIAAKRAYHQQLAALAI